MAAEEVAPVEDDEHLYRRVPATYIKFREDGPYVGAQAFDDREYRCCVDRAHLIGFDAKITQGKPQNGVLTVIAGEVRQFTTLRKDKKGNDIPKPVFGAEVFPEPSEGVAHAEIRIINFEIDEKTGEIDRFGERRLYERLTEHLWRLSWSRRWTVIPVAPE